MEITKYTTDHIAYTRKYHKTISVFEYTKISPLQNAADSTSLLCGYNSIVLLINVLSVN